MIRCSICNSDNHHLAVVCKKCGAFLQNKIETLDLFRTAGNVLEKPTGTFHTISVSRHKNYSLFLSLVAGIGFVFTVFWLVNAGELTNSLLTFLGIGFLIGPPLGVLTVLVFSLVCMVAGRVAGTSVRFRNCFAVVAYALIPTVISVILVFPLEIMTFGLHFFSKNPSPSLLKPTTYILLLILNGIFALWTLILLELGIKKLIDRSHIISIVVMSACIGVVAGLYYLAYWFIAPHVR